MLKNYVLVALRTLLKNKSYVIINTFGLGIAMACCIAAYLFIAYNLEFDNFHRNEKVAKIYKFHTHLIGKDGKIAQRNINVPMALPPVAAQEVAGIERYVRYIGGGGYMRYEDKAFSENISFADSTFFDMFDYPLVSGNHQSFKGKHSIFLSEKLAKKYFGEDDPVGKLMTMNFPNDQEIEVMVGGVIKKVPLNNTFVFDALMRIENYIDVNHLAVDDWHDWRDPSTFVELTSPENAANLTKQFAKYIPRRNEAKKDAVVESYHLEPFKASFTQDDIAQNYINLRMSRVPMIVFTSMALLILLIACFNLTNTSIAMTSKRLKEVGVRKAIGAARQQIITQFLFETVITIVLALLSGLLMSLIIVPAFANLWNFPFGMADLDGLNLFIALMIIVFIASLLAGIYPAVFNSKFKPVALLKGNVKIKGTNTLTRVLVSFQFALSVIVLVAGVVFIRNTRFQEKIKFGYDKDMVITVDIQSEREYETMENEIRKNPKILNVAVSDHHIGYNNYQNPVQVDTAEYEIRLSGVGKNYFETMGFEFSEGRPFNMDNTSDLFESAIVNQAFLDKVKLQDPIDKLITIHGVKRHIVGVVSNHIDNLYRSKDPEPFAFYPAEAKNYKLILVRAEKSDLGDVKKYLETTWKNLFPQKPFQGQLQEDIVLRETKRVNENLEKIFLFLTLLGGVLSASGIFALASLNIAKRTKEIGIRKALGATIGNIVFLLNKEFIIILSVAAVLGSLGGYYATDALLAEIYAYRIAVGIIPVVLCATFIFIVGIMTTSSTIFKAAQANPVDTLRDE